MITLKIPGRGEIHLKHLVTDVNGTLAQDGKLIDGVLERITQLRDRLEVHMLTADTHGKQKYIDAALGLKAVRVSPGGEAEQKAEFVRSLGAEGVVALGQGANDALMLKEAAIGICILSGEGTATEALLSADLIAPDVLTALDLLLHPIRMVASLRR